MNKIRNIGFIFILICVFCYYMSSSNNELKVEILYNEDNITGNSQIFWTDGNNQWDETTSSMGKLENGNVVLNLNEKFFKGDYYRLDSMDNDQTHTIDALKFFYDKDLFCVLEGKYLEKYIKRIDNIDSIETNNGLCIKPQNSDPNIIFNEELTELIHQCYKNEKQFGSKNIIFTLFLAVLLVIYANLFLICRKIKKIGNKIKQDFEIDNKWVFFYFLVILIGITSVIYWRYLIGEHLYIFINEIANDSGVQTYPYMVALARNIEMGNFNNVWNGMSSLGNVQEKIFPTLNNWVAWFGVNNVAYLMGVSQFLKVILAGLFFYMYLRTIGITRATSSIFSINYAYCAQIIVRGAWQAYPNEVVLLAFWLFCFEMFYKKKEYRYLPIATAIFFLNFNGYYTVLYTGIFCTYAIFRYYSEHQFRNIGKLRIKEHLFFLCSIILGIMISAFNTIPSILGMLESNRFSSGAINFTNKFDMSSVFANQKEVKTVYLRAIGNDILGVFSDEYVGSMNFLEGPAFYCGLLGLLLIPFAILGFGKRKRVWYLVGFVGSLCYIFINPIRYIANGFSSLTYKLASLWIIVFILLMVSQTFEKIMDYKLDLFLVFIVTIIYVLLAFLCYIDGLDNLYLVTSILILILYGGLLASGNRKINITFFKLFFLILGTMEAFLMSYRVVNDREVFTKEMISSMQYYNDGTAEIVSDLKEIDDGFFRTDKTYTSVFLCDSLYQGYYGTKGYIGGSGDRELTKEFYETMGFPILLEGHFMYGFGSSTRINTLLNVKYYLTKDDTECLNFGYKKIEEDERISLYENDNSLPLGNYYEQYILKEDFDKLTVAQKRNVMLKACVIATKEDADKARAFGLKKMSFKNQQNSLAEIKEVENYLVKFTEVFKNDKYKICFKDLAEENIAIIKLKIKNEDRLRYVGTMQQMISKIIFGNGTTNYIFYNNFMKGTDEYIYEFNVPGTNQVTFEITEDMEVEEVEVYIMPQSVYYKGYLDSVKKLGSQTLELSEWTDSYYKGNYSGEKDGLVFFAIPYDEDWHLTVDGKDVPIIQANIGFMGAFIEAGEHDIVLEYHSNQSIYYICSAIGCILYVAYVIICVRKRGKKNVPSINCSAGL